MDKLEIKNEQLVGFGTSLSVNQVVELKRKKKKKRGDLCEIIKIRINTGTSSFERTEIKVSSYLEDDSNIKFF